MFEILIFLFALSVPILYIRGIWSFFVQNGKNQTPPKDDWEEIVRSRVFIKELRLQVKRLQVELDKKNKSWDMLEKRAESEPALTISAFLDEMLFETNIEVSEELSAAFEKLSDENPEEFTSEQIIQEERAPSFATLMQAPISPSYREEVKQVLSEEPKTEKIQAETAPKEQFNWRNWYADNAINLLLFLGAFLVVAAVGFFISIQWGNLDGLTRFGIVLSFTGAWYVAGFLFNRGESLKTVGITFVTIGALLTPFCGLAYQQFVIGSMDGVGLTWLLTSIFTTVSYMSLSLYFQRRYFTYFGTLSILAMLLALVQIANAPQEFFVLAGTATALILLFGRLALRRFPELDNYLGQDYEKSSIATFLLSLAAGLVLLPITGIGFFSIQITIVGLSTAIYLWVYCSLNEADYFVLGAQLLSILLVPHALISLKFEPALIMGISLVAQFTIQVALHFAYRHRETVLKASHSMSLLYTSSIYGISFAFVELRLVPLVYALALMGHLSYYAVRFNILPLFYLVVGLSYFVLGHFLRFMGMELSQWAYALLGLGVIELAISYRPIRNYLREPMRYIALLVIALSGFWGYLTLSSETTMTIYWMNYAAIGVMLVFAFLEKRQEEKIIAPQIHLGSALVGVAYYLFSFNVPLAFPQAVLASLVGLQFLFAYRHLQHSALAACVAITSYAVVWHLLSGLVIPTEHWGTVFALLATAQIAFLYSSFEKTWCEGIVYIGMLGLGIAVIAAFNNFAYLFRYQDSQWLLNLTSLFAISVYAGVSYLESLNEEKLISPYAHLLGVSMGIYLAIYSFFYSEYMLSSVYSLGAIALLLLAYRHKDHVLYIMSACIWGYVALHSGFVVLGFGFTLMSVGFVVYCIVLMALAFSPLEEKVRSASVHVGLYGISLGLVLHSFFLGFLSSLFYSSSRAGFDIAVLLGISSLLVFEEIQTHQAQPIIGKFSRALSSFAIFFVYCLSFGLHQVSVSASYAIFVMLSFIQAFRRSQWTGYLFAIVGMCYAALINLLVALNVPLEVYPIAISLLSVAIYVLRERLVAQYAPILIRLILLALAGTSYFSFQVAMISPSASLHIAGWLSGYTLLGIFWHSHIVRDARSQDIVLAVGIYLLYVWHIFYAMIYLDDVLFQNLQWFSAGIGIAFLVLAIRESQRNEGKLPRALLMISAASFLLPAYGQSLAGDWFYTGLAIFYALIFVGIGILYRSNNAQIIGSVGIVVAILIPTGNFLLGLPIWVFALLIGMGLITAAVFLTMRRRNMKKVNN